jgi:hypothetical protein
LERIAALRLQWAMRAWLQTSKAPRSWSSPADALPSDPELLVALVAELRAVIEQQAGALQQWQDVAHQLRRTAQLLESSVQPRRPRSFDPTPVAGEGRFSRQEVDGRSRRPAPDDLSWSVVTLADAERVG